ncbi:MAG: hypothetical protein WC098_05535 [Bacteroidales bacterium]
MLKKQYVELFDEVRAMPLDAVCAPTLASLCFGYRQLLLLSYVDPGFTEAFGKEAQPVALAGHMQQVVYRLANHLNKDLPEDEWVRDVVYLLEALSFQYDSEQLHTALNAMDDFFAQEETKKPHVNPGYHEDVCKMHCYRFYFSSNLASARQAKAMIESWLDELAPSGIWENLNVNHALSRIGAVVLYANTVNQNTFRPHIRRLIERYSKAEGIEYEIRLLPILDVSGYFNKYRVQARRTLEYLLHVKEETITALFKGQIMRKHLAPCDFERLLLAVRFYLQGIYWYHTTALENGNGILRKQEDGAW